MERKRFSWLLNAVILTAFIAIGGFLGHSILILRSALRSGSQYQVLPDQSILRLDSISTPLVGDYSLLERLDGRTGKVLARRKIVAGKDTTWSAVHPTMHPVLIPETNQFHEAAIRFPAPQTNETPSVQIIDSLNLLDKRAPHQSSLPNRFLWDKSSGELICQPDDIQFDSNVVLDKTRNPWNQVHTATFDHGEIFFVLWQPNSSKSGKTDEVFRLEGNKAVSIVTLPEIHHPPGLIQRSWQLTYDGHQFLVALSQDPRPKPKNWAYVIDISKGQITWKSPELPPETSIRPIGSGRFYIGNRQNEEIVDHQGTSIAKLDRGLRDGWVTLFTSDVKTLIFPRRLGWIQLVDAKSLEVLGKFSVKRSYTQFVTLCVSLFIWAGLLTVLGQRLFHWRPEIVFLAWAWVLWIFQWAVRGYFFSQFEIIYDGISQSIILSLILYWSWLCMWVIRGHHEFIGRASCVISLLVIQSVFCSSAYYGPIQGVNGNGQMILLPLLFLSLWIADRAFLKLLADGKSPKSRFNLRVQFGIRELLLLMCAVSLVIGILPWRKHNFFDFSGISIFPRITLVPVFSLLAMLYLSRLFWDFSLRRRWLVACIPITMLVAFDFAIAWYAEYPASFETRMKTTVMHIPQVIAFGLVVPRLGFRNTMKRMSDSQLTAEA